MCRPPEQLVARLAAFSRNPAVPLDGRKAASVVLAVATCGGELGVWVTRRSSRLRAHSGQWALPGGRADPGEDPVTAGLRELHEELGVRAAPADVLGCLDDYPTRSGYVMTPVVVWLGEAPDLAPNPAEVATVHWVTFADLDVDPLLRSIPESDRPLIQLPLLGTLIHAPTAAVLHQFREVALHGRGTRVEHLEQPVFAWR